MVALPAVLLARLDSACQGSCHQFGNAVLGLAREAKYLDPGRGEFLLGAHAHAAGDHMSDPML